MKCRDRSRAVTRTSSSTSTTSPAPTAARGRPSAMRARCAPDSRTAAWTRSSSRECTNSSANSSTTTTASAPPSPSNTCCRQGDGGPADGQTAAGLGLARAIWYAPRRTLSVSAHAYQHSHLTSYRYETPATSVIQMLRLTPRNHDGQYVARWRIDVSTDCRLDQHEDAFGNITHVFTAEGPFTELAVAVEGEVETRDTQG